MSFTIVHPHGFQKDHSDKRKLQSEYKVAHQKISQKKLIAHLKQRRGTFNYNLPLGRSQKLGLVAWHPPNWIILPAPTFLLNLLRLLQEHKIAGSGP